MIKEKVSVGLIGAGKVSYFHGKGYADLKGRVEVTVADIIEGNARERADQIGAMYVADYGQLLKDETIDAVDICLPNDLHAPVSIEACEAGKHVLVEKPMAITVKEADEMIRAARKNSVRLMVVHSNRFLPVNIYVREALPSIGEISWIHVTKEHSKCPGTWYADPEKSGGGVLLDVGVHAADLILWFSSQKVHRISASSACINTLPLEDMAFCQMEFSGKSKASFFVTWASPFSSNAMKIKGSQGGITSDMKSQQVIMTGSETEPVFCPQTEAETAMTVKAFVKCIREEKEPPITGEDGKKALQIITAAYSAAEKQEWVTL
ncbi:MAG: Gfo/Idh/MocA family oxidoreductase [Theionarchaea archaeon]|nr:Gfo/Idh/MocA family oxidoreductase [Theionarchaea archaeon]